MDQIVDAVPGLPRLDVLLPLMVEQLADVLSLIAEHEKEMDRIEDLILVGSPVSTADRKAWRRWAKGSSSSSDSKRKKKKRWKRKLPKKAAVGRFGDPAVAFHRQAGGRPVLGQGGCCCPLLGNDRSGGSDRGVPAPQIMGIVEVTPLALVIVGVIVVCQCHRSWRSS